MGTLSPDLVSTTTRSGESSQCQNGIGDGNKTIADTPVTGVSDLSLRCCAVGSSPTCMTTVSRPFRHDDVSYSSGRTMM